MHTYFYLHDFQCLPVLALLLLLYVPIIRNLQRLASSNHYVRKRTPESVINCEGRMLGQNLAAFTMLGVLRPNTWLQIRGLGAWQFAGSFSITAF